MLWRLYILQRDQAVLYLLMVRCCIANIILWWFCFVIIIANCCCHSSQRGRLFISLRIQVLVNIIFSRVSLILTKLRLICYSKLWKLSCATFLECCKLIHESKLRLEHLVILHDTLLYPGLHFTLHISDCHTIFIWLFPEHEHIILLDQIFNWLLELLFANIEMVFLHVKVIFQVFIFFSQRVNFFHKLFILQVQLV